MDPNTDFLSNALLRHFELSEQDRASRDSSEVEDEFQEEESDEYSS